MIILISTFIILSLITYSQTSDVVELPVSPERSRDYDAIHYEVTFSVDLDKK